MKIRPLIVNGTEIPLREPSPLQVLAHLQAGARYHVDTTYLLLAWIGDLGAATPRRRDEDLRDYAERVLAWLPFPMLDVIRAADLCFGDAIEKANILPTRAEVAQAGESSTEEMQEKLSSTP